MNNDTITPNGNSSKMESFSFYIFLATIILAPLVFWLNPYITQDLIKSFVIAIGVIVSAILIGFVAMKEKSISLLPRSLCRTGTFLTGSIIVSSLLSIHISKSLFGQGFEIGSASFILILMLAGFVAFTVVGRQKDRAVVLYVGIAVSYLVVFVLHLLRMIFGAKFMTLGILNSATSSIIGGWYNLATFSAIIFIIAILAVMFLRLSSRMKIAYWVLAVLSFIGILVIADSRVWQILTLVFLGLSICLSILKWNVVKQSGLRGLSAVIKSLSWIPVVVFIISALLVWRGPSIVGPIITKMNVAHMELVLPWQMTLGVTASVVQSYPLFGVGSNNFSQAFLAYKPIQINSTNAWSAEFSYGFGYIPTFVATHGVVGSILWVLLLIFFGIISTKVLRNLPTEADRKFMILSSFTSAVFLILVSFVSVPSHSILLLVFVFAGIFLGLSSAYGLLPIRTYAPTVGTKMYKIFSSIVALAILILVVWGLIYFKKTIAFNYFGNGVKILNSAGDVEKIDQAFSKALKLDQSDAYWRGKAEVALVAAQKMADQVTPATPASTTQAILSEINNILNKGLADAKKATAYDPTNHYNFLSEARVSEVAANIKMQNGYENAVSAYNSAININPYNPAIYLSLANLQAKQAKYDDALATLGRALQVKNNYLDAVFLLSQVYAAKGDINNAIVAAKVAVQLNPQNSILLFQLGMLDYNAKDYAGAVQAFTEAIKYQADYANAKYFLGLSHARLNKMAEAIALFEDLSATNPENQEVALILSNLRSGRSIFTDAKAPVTAPEKRSSLPIKEKK
jgi:tetratricopeptide (TPR) repeat protein